MQNPAAQVEVLYMRERINDEKEGKKGECKDRKLTIDCGGGCCQNGHGNPTTQGLTRVSFLEIKKGREEVS